MENVGLKWYKCDFHLHTMNSRCYKNKEIDTVNEWIDEVKNKGLKCIAVTDHNDYRKIDEIKKLGEENNIVVFPGVELSALASVRIALNGSSSFLSPALSKNFLIS